LRESDIQDGDARRDDARCDDEVCTTLRRVTWPTCVCRLRLRMVVVSHALQSPVQGPSGALDLDIYTLTSSALLCNLQGKTGLENRFLKIVKRLYRFKKCF